MVGTFFTLYKGYTWLGKYRLDLNPLTITQLILAQPTELWSLSSRATNRVDFIAKVNADFFSSLIDWLVRQQKCSKLQN